MRTRYDVLISVHVEHKYFTDRFFDSFELKPDKKTKTSIQYFGLLVKKIRNNWFLLYQSDGPRKTDTEALVNKEFVFILDIKDNAFDQYTNPDLIPKSKSIQFYAATIDNKFFSSSRFIEAPVFDYTIQHSERPVNIKLKKFKGEVLKDAAIIESSQKKYTFDLTATGEQAYDISENTLPPTDERKREIFVHESYFNDPFYGMLYFKVVQADKNTNQYNLVFEKK
ncbi:MAG TPA: hypothetical protein VGQ04_21265 [Chitinophagaceae bacterium]|jgi:uncharacterized UPF0160 family protein|nr:hypothetical protein [Chitinophagaceae bacterium]